MEKNAPCMEEGGFVRSRPFVRFDGERQMHDSSFACQRAFFVPSEFQRITV